jgi:hypothetical protein
MANATSTQLQELYVAYFGRAADPTGLDYWTEEGTTQAAFAAHMYAQAEFKDAYGSKSVEAQVNQIYKNLFDREADVTGLTYWTQQINLGVLKVAEIATHLIWAAQNNSGSADDKTALTNRTNAAVAYTAEVKKTTANILAYQPTTTSPWVAGSGITEGISYLSGIDKDTAHTDAGITASVANLSTTTTTTDAAKSLVTTTGLDVLVGGTGDDSVTTDTATVSAADTFDGGAGTDSLTKSFTGEGAVILPALTNVETVTLTEIDTDEDGTGASFDALDYSTVSTWVLNHIDDDFTISNIDAADIVRIVENVGTTVDVTVTHKSLTGSADAAEIEVDAFDASSDLAVGALETLTIESVGSSASTIAALTAAAVTTLNLTATSSALTVTETDAGGANVATTVNVTGGYKVTGTNALSTAVTTIDASAATGGSEFSLSGLTAPTFTGGTGADVVTVITADATVNTGAGDDKVEINSIVVGAGSLDGGAGTDTLLINTASSTVFTTASKLKISNFETLEIEASTDTIDFNTLDTFSKLIIGTSTALDLDDFQSTVAAAGVDVTGVQTTSLIIETDDSTDPGVDNTLVLNLDHGTADTAVTIADFQANGFETMTITSAGAGTNTNSIEFGTENTELEKVTVSGASKFTLTVDSAGDLGAGDLTVDASGMTAVTTLTLTGEDDGTSLTLGSAADIVTGGTGVDIVVGGAGADTFNASSGLDKYTGGAGSDIYIMTTATADATDTLTITDFAKGTGGDLLHVDESAVAGGIVTGMTAGTTAYVEGSIGTVGVNNSATAFASNSFLVVTDQSFATYDALEAQIDIENGGTDLADTVTLFLDSTNGYAVMYADGVVGTTTNDEIYMAKFTDITTLTQLAEFNSSNFVVI